MGLINTAKALLAQGWKDADIIDVLNCRANSEAQSRAALTKAKAAH